MSPGNGRRNSDHQTIAVLSHAAGAAFGLVFGVLLGLFLNMYFIGDLMSDGPHWVLISVCAVGCAVAAGIYGQRFWFQLSEWWDEWF